MNRFLKRTVFAMAVILHLSVLLPSPSFALDTDNVISVKRFSDDSDYTIVECMDDQTAVSYKAFIDKQGNFACRTYSENIDKVIKMSGPYIAFTPTFSDEYYVADIKNREVIFSSAQSAQCDEILDMGSWNGQCYYVGHSSFAGFDAKGETYTIFEGNGRPVFEKTYSSVLNIAEYIGEGWFIFTDCRGALYINAETGKYWDFPNTAYVSNLVNKGYTYNFIDDDFVCIDLNSGSVSRIMLPDNQRNYVIEGRVAENKIVAFEYEPFQFMVKTKVKSVFYYSPDKGVVEITAWADHVYKSDYSSQYYHCKFVNGKLLLPMEGTDGCLYVGLVDENNQQLIEPIKTDYYRSYAADDGRIVVQQDGIDVVYDDQGNRLFSADQWGQERIEPYSGGFARVGDGIHFQRLIDRDGNLLMNELFVNIPSIPLMDIPY